MNVQLSASVPKELRDRVHAEAARRDVSVGQLVTWLVGRSLPAWEQVDLDHLTGLPHHE